MNIYYNIIYYILFTQVKACHPHPLINSQCGLETTKIISVISRIWVRLELYF